MLLPNVIVALKDFRLCFIRMGKSMVIALPFSEVGADADAGTLCDWLRNKYISFSYWLISCLSGRTACGGIGHAPTLWLA